MSRITKIKNNSCHTLKIIGTPIGNSMDLSPRGIEAFEQADFILCEDTRVTKKLSQLRNFRVQKLISFNDLSNDILDEYYKFIKQQIKFWINERESYYASILYYFKGYPKDLILIDIYKEWKSFLGDIVFEEYEITDNKMQACDRDYSKDQQKFLDAHKEIYEQATKDAFASYPKFVENSLLLHDNHANKDFLNIYKNNF